MPFAAVGDDNLYFEDHGSGETVVLLHHGFSAARMWDAIFPGIVEAGYRVVMFDRRGHGKSEPGPDFEEFYVRDSFVDENVESMAGLMSLLEPLLICFLGFAVGFIVISLFMPLVDLISKLS